MTCLGHCYCKIFKGFAIMFLFGLIMHCSLNFNIQMLLTVTTLTAWQHILKSDTGISLLTSANPFWLKNLEDKDWNKRKVKSVKVFHSKVGIYEKV